MIVNLTFMCNSLNVLCHVTYIGILVQCFKKLFISESDREKNAKTVFSCEKIIK